MISNYNTVWSPINERHQTGTWNTTGIIALAASCEIIMRTGWQKIIQQEKDLAKYTTRKLAAIPGLKLHVTPERYINEDRIGVFPFSLPGYHHALLSAILGHEYGVESRSGTICNHRLVRRWFDITDKQQREIEEKIKNGDRLSSYGAVRVSLGIHNTMEDIDALAEALGSISKNGPQLNYRPRNEAETFVPVI